MKPENDPVRERLLALIDSEFESDAAFERAMGLSEKTVSNWRRGRSNSFFKMLPALAQRLGVPVGDLLCRPIESGEELSEEEVRLLTLVRRAKTLPKAKRRALAETIEKVIELYLQK